MNREDNLAELASVVRAVRRRGVRKRRKMSTGAKVALHVVGLLANIVAAYLLWRYVILAR